MMKKLQTLLRVIEPSRGFNEEHETGVAMSPTLTDGGIQQRHAANPRPARLRGPWRPARARRRRGVVPR